MSTSSSISGAISSTGPQKVYSYPEQPKKAEKSSRCSCWQKKKKDHSRELTDHEIAYSKILRVEAAKQKALEEKKS